MKLQKKLGGSFSGDQNIVLHSCSFPDTLLVFFILNQNASVNTALIASFVALPILSRFFPEAVDRR